MASANPLSEGSAVFIRTVTHYYTGRIAAVLHGEGDVPVPGFMLEQATWIASTGQYKAFLQGAPPEEAVQYPSNMRVFVAARSIIDANTWQHPLPGKPSAEAVPHPFQKGKKLFLRSVTHYTIGDLVQTVGVGDAECPIPGFVLRNAVWIASTGKFGDFLANGQSDEVQEYTDEQHIFVHADGLVDAVAWPHPNPRSK